MNEHHSQILGTQLASSLLPYNIYSPCPPERRQGRTDSNLPPQDATSPLPPDPLLLFPSECPPAWQTVCREHLNWCKNRAKNGPVEIHFGSFFLNLNAFFPQMTKHWLWNLACIMINMIDIFWKLFYRFDKIWNSARNISIDGLPLIFLLSSIKDSSLSIFNLWPVLYLFVICDLLKLKIIIICIKSSQGKSKLVCFWANL